MKTLNVHTSAITCLTLLSNEKFVSGGNDRQLRIWDFEGDLKKKKKNLTFHLQMYTTKGNLISSIERQEEENLHCLLYIGDKQNNNTIQSVKFLKLLYIFF